LLSEQEGGARDSEALRPYVPRLIFDWLRHSPGERVREVEGTLAFADISGFTRLTERLARLGRIGAEEMSDTLDTTFGRLLSVAYADGAQLLKWGGDAVLLLFDGADHATRACHAAYGMRAAIRDLGRLHTAAGSVELRMSTGIHSGALHLFLVGNPEHHRELMVCGPGVSATARMESLAGQAGIALTPEAAAQIDPRLLTAGEGYFLLRTEPDAGRRFVMESADISGLDLARCLSLPIRKHLLAAAGESEHRTVSVAFIGFSGADDVLERSGADALAQALDDLVRNVQDAAARHGVTFLESDIDVGGGKILLVAGAPTSGGQDEDRMLRAARLIVDRAGALPLRIGINRGNVFAGDFGHEYRRTYSIKGDAVNVGARLMGKAALGHIVAAVAVVDRSRTGYDVRALEPLALKGKKEKVRAFDVGAAAAEKQSLGGDRRLVGRDAELAILLDAWEEARVGRGRLVDLVGEPGIGKSSLVAELVRRAEGAAVFHATADPYESSTPYFVWKSVLRHIAGIAPDVAPPEDAIALAGRIRELKPELAPWLPLVAIPMGIQAQATAATTDLDEKFRKARLEEVTAALVYAALETPALIVIDDVHLLDDPSADLLARLKRDASRNPALIIVTRRDQPSGYVPAAGPDVLRMDLGALDQDAAAALLAGVAGDTALRPDELATLARRAAGNPLFLKELVAAAAGAGSVAGLPDTIEGLVTTQIDRLSPTDRTILRHASVLGATFTRRLLGEMLGSEQGSVLAALPPTLDSFLVRESGDTFRFQHSLIRDAAYEGLPFRRRKELHGRAGAVIEASAKNPDDQAALLSMHYFHALRFDKAWRYSVSAGDHARAQYANPEAAEFYARAIDAARHVPSIAFDELAPVLESLGDVRYLVGQSSAAIAAYREARIMSRGKPVKQAELIRNLARIQVRQGQFIQALRLLTQGRHLLDGVQGEAATAMRAILAGQYAVCRYRQGNLRDAMRWARTSVNEGEASGDATAKALAYQALDTVHRMSGITPDRPYDRLALGLYEQAGNLAAQAQMLNNMAIGAFFAGDWADAHKMFGQARDVYLRVGDMTPAGSALHNMGEVLIAQGRIDEAQPILSESMRLARSVGDRETAAADLKQLGRGAAHQGHFDEAIRLLEQARDEAAAMGSAHEVADTEAAIAESTLFAGDPSAALYESAKALDHAQQAGATRVLPTLARIRGFALMQLGSDADARVAFDDACRFSSEPGTQHERAFALAGLARLAERAGDRERSRALAAESQEMLDRLGVVSAPMVLAVMDDEVDREVEVQERVP
jgi:class 3 adenylate cyclase/tetratricopeptide (TPR) repeat protein